MSAASWKTQSEDHWAIDEDIDFRHYLNVINRRKWAIVGLTLTVGLLTTLVVFAMTPIYIGEKASFRIASMLDNRDHVVGARYVSFSLLFIGFALELASS